MQVELLRVSRCESIGEGQRRYLLQLFKLPLYLPLYQLGRSIGLVFLKGRGCHKIYILLGDFLQIKQFLNVDVLLQVHLSERVRRLPVRKRRVHALSHLRRHLINNWRGLVVVVHLQVYLDDILFLQINSSWWCENWFSWFVRSVSNFHPFRFLGQGWRLVIDAGGI